MPKTILAVCCVLMLGLLPYAWDRSALIFAQENGGAATPDQPTTTSSPNGFKLEGLTEFAVRFREVAGDRPAKFEEYRDLRNGFVLEYFKFLVSKENSPFFFDVTGKKAAYRDQEYQLNFGVVGKYKSTFQFSSVPHFFSDRNKFILTRVEPGFFSINDTVRAALQNATDAETLAILRTLVANAPEIDLRLKREQTQFTQSFTPHRSWNLFYDFFHESRKGLRAFNAGTYIRRPQPTGDAFEALGIELPEPIRYRTYEFRAGATYTRDRGFLSVVYDASFFRNKIGALRWTNPFRLTDALADPPGGATGRGRFALGQFDLYPDNNYNSFIISSGLNFWKNLRLNNTLSYGRTTQDDPFLPITVNTAIIATPSTTPATSLSLLPRPSLDAKVDTVKYNLDLSSRTHKKFSWATRYRLYEYNDKTERILFPGYAAFGESWWLTNIAGEPIERINKGFFRQNAGADATFRPTDMVTLKFDYNWEGWNYQYRNITRTNQHAVGGSVQIKPKDLYLLRIGYRRSQRDFVGNYRSFREPSNLRNFDVANRDQDKVHVAFQLEPSDKVSVSLLWQYYGDRYKDSPLGLSTFYGYVYGADVFYRPTNDVTFYVNYNRDLYRTEYNLIAKSGAPLSAVYDLRNLWTRNSKDSVDSFGTGLNNNFMKGKMNFDLSYNFSLARGEIATRNFVTPPASPLSAQAFPFPDTRVRLHEVKTSLSYKLRDNLALGLRYWYEPFQLDDFTWDVLTPIMVGQIAPENNALRYLFMNTRYSSYHAHVGSVFLRYSF